MPNFNSLPLDIVNDRYYKAITNGGVQAAVSTIATQLSTFRFAAEVLVAVQMLRDLIEDILRAQGGQVLENVLPPAASAENLISDATTVTAFGTIRTYLAGTSAPTYPVVGVLQSKQAFGPLARVIAECI